MGNLFMALTPPTVSTTDFEGILNNITATITPAVITGIMADIVTMGAPYALLYWGARKCLKAIFSAVKKGKVRI